MHAELEALKILNMNLESAKVKDLRMAIAEAKADGGTQKMKKADLVAYAEKVVAIRGDGYVGAINTDNVDHLMDVDELPDDGDVFVADAEPVAAPVQPADEPSSEEPVTVENTLDALRERVKQVLGGRSMGAPKVAKPLNPTFVDLFKNTIKDAKPDDNGVIIINTDMIRAAGWSPTYSKITNGWTRTKSAGRAAIECGFNTRTKRDGDAFIVICTPIKTPVVAEQPASADAAE